MGPGVGAQRRGPVPEGCLMKSIMTALAPLKSRHPRLGQSLWWLWVMRPQCACVPVCVCACVCACACIWVCVYAGGGGGGGNMNLRGRTSMGQRVPLECRITGHTGSGGYVHVYEYVYAYVYCVWTAGIPGPQGPPSCCA